MRITGGSLKGRLTETPNGKMAIRPAMDRMRESIFGILGDLSGKSFLDLFSGSGTIAIEAVSHGAFPVSLCEMDKSKAKTVLSNVEITEKELGKKIDCHFMAVELFLKRCKSKFDYIFFDPPFPYKFRLELLQTAAKRALITEDGTILIHRPSEDPLPETIGTLVRTDQRIYGRSIVDFYKYSKKSQKNEIETAKKD
jgi:16S rRNA (guanine(966)-N(2))-methyltransferase RsmD